MRQSNQPRAMQLLRWKFLIIFSVATILTGVLIIAPRTVSPNRTHPQVADLSSIVQGVERQWTSPKLGNRKAAINYIAKHSRSNKALFAATRTIIEAAAQDVDEQVRTVALKVLAENHSSNLLSMARFQLGDDDPAVRLIGLHALLAVEPNAAVNAARPLLDDPTAAVQVMAVKVAARSARATVDQLDQLLSREFPLTWQPTSIEAQSLAEHIADAKQRKGGSEPAERPILTPRQRIPMPSAELLNLNGESTSLKAYTGQPLLISFWDFADTNSVEMLNTLTALRHELADTLKVIAIYTDQREHAATNKCDHSAVDRAGNHLCKNPTPTFDFAKTAARIRAETQRRHLSLNMLVDVSGTASHRFATDMLPACTIVDPQGIIARRFVGIRSLDSLRVIVSAVIPRSPSIPVKL